MQAAESCGCNLLQKLFYQEKQLSILFLNALKETLLPADVIKILFI
jgi:hypothetical protein